MDQGATRKRRAPYLYLAKPRGGQMSELKEMTQSFYREVVNAGNLDAIDEFVDEDFIEHEQEEVPSGMGLGRGREGFKTLVGAYLAAFDPFHAEVRQQFQDGDTVIS